VAVSHSDSGAVMERLAYDPWGKRRNHSGPADPKDLLVGSTTERGYTRHEHLEELAFIHMNARVYDPTTARFMSADPVLQNPYNLQSHNRYSYVMNNPLGWVDPSGNQADGPSGCWLDGTTTGSGGVPEVVVRGMRIPSMQDGYAFRRPRIGKSEPQVADTGTFL
jgi:RHS repeat-associated protein